MDTERYGGRHAIMIIFKLALSPIGVKIATPGGKLNSNLRKKYKIERPPNGILPITRKYYHLSSRARHVRTYGLWSNAE